MSKPTSASTDAARPTEEGVAVMQACKVCGLPIVKLIFEGQPVYVDPYIRTFAPIVPPDRLDQAAEEGDTAWRSGARVEHSAVCKKPYQKKGKS